MEARSNIVVVELLRCREWIEAALEHSGGTHDFADIAKAVMRGEMQLWPNENGCLVTEIVSFPKKKTLNVFLGGGKMRDLLAMYGDIEAWATAQGCDGMTINGRQGWQRIFAKRGWKVQNVCLSKEIDK